MKLIYDGEVDAWFGAPEEEKPKWIEVIPKPYKTFRRHGVGVVQSFLLAAYYRMKT